MSDYIIKKGETLTSIAKKHNVSVKDIQNTNNISNPDKISVGQKISIPLIKEPISPVLKTDVQINAKSKEKELTKTLSEKLQMSNYDLSISNKDNKKMLEISRFIDDKYDYNNRYNINIGSIKDKLGIKDGVFAKYNDMVHVTRSRCWSDDNTIDPGQSLFVPLSELGQKETKFLGITIKNKDYEEIKNAVSEFLK